jgi:hypothetical protein
MKFLGSSAATSRFGWETTISLKAKLEIIPVSIDFCATFFGIPGKASLRKIEVCVYIKKMNIYRVC